MQKHYFKNELGHTTLYSCLLRICFLKYFLLHLIFPKKGHRSLEANGVHILISSSFLQSIGNSLRAFPTMDFPLSLKWEDSSLVRLWFLRILLAYSCLVHSGQADIIVYSLFWILTVRKTITICHLHSSLRRCRARQPYLFDL